MLALYCLTLSTLPRPTSDLLTLCKALSALPKLVCTSLARSDFATALLKARLPRSANHFAILPNSTESFSPVAMFARVEAAVNAAVTLLPLPVLSSLLLRAEYTPPDCTGFVLPCVGVASVVTLTSLIALSTYAKMSWCLPLGSYTDASMSPVPAPEAPRQ